MTKTFYNTLNIHIIVVEIGTIIYIYIFSPICTFVTILIDNILCGPFQSKNNIVISFSFCENTEC